MAVLLFRLIIALLVASALVIANPAYSSTISSRETAESYLKLIMAVQRSHIPHEQRLENIRSSGLLSDNSPIANAFKPVVLANEEDRESLAVETVRTPTANDWASLLEANPVAYAITRGIYQQIHDENAIASHRQLKSELLVYGHKEAVAQVSYLLGRYLGAYRGYVSAQIEYLYALPELMSVDSNTALTRFTKEDALLQIAQIFYLMGTYNEARPYALRLLPKFETVLEQAYGEYVFIQLPLILSMAGDHENAMHVIKTYKQLTGHANYQHLHSEYLLAASITLILRNQKGDLAEARDLLKQFPDGNKSGNTKYFLSLVAKVLIAAIDGRDQEVSRIAADLKELAKSLNDYDRTSNRDAALAVATAYELLGDEKKAVEAKNESMSYDGNVLKSSITSSLNSIDRLMQSEMDSLLVANFKAQVEHQRLELEAQKRNYIIVALIFALLLLSILWMWRRQKLMRTIAEIDSLTGALNRRAMLKWLEAYKSKGGSHCACLIDLDNFKKINDQYGHDTGDEVLQSFSQLVLSRVRKTDKFCRYGGEEFLLILHDVNLAEANALISAIRNEFKNITEWQTTHSSFSPNFSAGLIELNKPIEFKSMIKKCDALLYESKDKGRAQTTTLVL